VEAHLKERLVGAIVLVAIVVVVVPELLTGPRGSAPPDGAARGSSAPVGEVTIDLAGGPRSERGSQIALPTAPSSPVAATELAAAAPAK